MTIRHCLLLLFLVLGISPIFGQEKDTDTADFPASWVGNWKGELKIYTGRGLGQTIPMQLRIHPVNDSTYTYGIVYGPDEKSGLRDYQLDIIDAKNGIYRIDEKNTILMDSYLLGGKFYSTFEVLGNYLVSTTEIIEGKMIYEIISGDTEAISITGNAEHNGEPIPKVKSYPVRVRQIAILEREEP